MAGAIDCSFVSDIGNNLINSDDVIVENGKCYRKTWKLFDDLKENSAYHEARNMKSFLLGRIEQLENAVNDSVIVEKKEGGAVQVGSEISIVFDGKEQTYKITAPSESDILKNRLSYQSPLGQQLMGKKAGSEFAYEVKGKSLKVKVLKVN